MIVKSGLEECDDISFLAGRRGFFILFFSWYLLICFF